MEKKIRDKYIEAHDIIVSAGAEIKTLENLLNELIEEDDDVDLPTVVQMVVEARNFRLKFSKIAEGFFDKKYNIVNLAKQRLQQG